MKDDTNWFKDLGSHERLINPAREVSSFLKKILDKKGRSISSSTYYDAHYRYLMKYDDIKPNGELPNKPVSLRVLEKDEDGLFAIHDLSLNKDDPKLYGTMFGERSLQFFETTIEAIKALGISESVGEIRHLSIPVINVEAIWYSSNNTKSNIFFMRKAGSKELEKKTKNEFLNYLNELKVTLQKDFEEKTQNGGMDQKLVG